ncbi:MAG: D-alanyl-D-alanine carboxypeptidase/D-alanyl-D-alanine-endopeptidase [Pseudomonadota bacterium]
MSGDLTRRGVLAGLLGSVGTVALAEAPLVSLRPVSRPGEGLVLPPDIPALAPPIRPGIADLIEAAQLGGDVACVVADARTGEELVAVGADIPLPPASVTKAVTALYALDALGGGFRFVTRVVAMGDVTDGVLEGDLVLVGGGDPTLSADHLAQLAADVAEAGIVQVRGRLLCWRGALPYAEEIEPSQLDYLGYNPAVSGLNLNYNRVHFEWKRSGGAWQTTMDARTEDRVPPVSMARVRIVDRASPVFTAAGPDRWTVARSALGQGGSRWMPVRQPALYAGDVFRAVAREVDLTLPAPEVIDDLPEGFDAGQEVAQHRSPTLRTICQEMLLYSTNLTAEICGLAATQARVNQPLDIVASAQVMNDWLGETYGIEAAFKDHSGLSDENRISAAAMQAILLQEGPASALRPILRRIAMRDADRNRIEDYPVVVRAKTGTLNFVSSLSGFIETATGDDLIFTIFTANLERRAQGKASGAEVPEGSIAWNRRSKRLQQQVLQRWGLTSREDAPAAEAQATPGGVSLDGILPDLDEPEGEGG